MMNTIFIPRQSLVFTVGPAASGKSTFLRDAFDEYAVVSSDKMRHFLTGDPTNQKCSQRAFKLIHEAIRERLCSGMTTVLDATNLHARSRQPLYAIAQELGVPTVALVFDRSLDHCMENNQRRDRRVPEHVIAKHYASMGDALQGLRLEPVTRVIRIPQVDWRAGVAAPRVLCGSSYDSIDSVDVIGDIHGCAAELYALLDRLGYFIVHRDGVRQAFHPEGRRLAFVGDFADRGPNSLEVLRLVLDLVSVGHHAVMGNHCWKLFRALSGRNVTTGHGLAETLQELRLNSTTEEMGRIQEFLGSLPASVFFYKVGGGSDVGFLAMSHAGLPTDEFVWSTDSGRMLEMAIYGEVLNKQEALKGALPVRGTQYADAWMENTTDTMWQVHGHSPCEEPMLRDRVVNVDQGCVFGGQLTAFRWPEKTFVSVTAARDYTNPNPET